MNAFALSTSTTYRALSDAEAAALRPDDLVWINERGTHLMATVVQPMGQGARSSQHIILRRHGNVFESFACYGNLYAERVTFNDMSHALPMPCAKCGDDLDLHEWVVQENGDGG